jgi:hypothetical protein
MFSSVIVITYTNKGVCTIYALLIFTTVHSIAVINFMTKFSGKTRVTGAVLGA